MDVTQFKMIRPVRGHDDDGIVRLAAKTRLQPRPPPAPDPKVGPKPKPSAEVPEEVWIALDTLPAEFGPIDADPLARTDGAGNAILPRIYEVLNQLDQLLAASNDRLAGEALRDAVAGLMLRYRLDKSDWAALLGDGAAQGNAFQVALLALRGELWTAMAGEPEFERATRLCRLALIAALLELRFWRLADLTPEQVFDRMNRQTVVLDSIPAVEIVPDPQVELIREAKVADLQVVRREWAGYVASEIANIRNVMQGESFGQSDKTMRETETTTETVTESRESTEREDQSKLDSELTHEVTSQLEITINGHANASAEFKYPVMTAQVSAGVDAGFSLQRSERHAGKVAREAVSRAVSRVDSMTRESRTRRELMRSEQSLTAAIDNKGGGNVHGVYRWVDRVDTYQLFRYPDRFLLEFQFPEPAEFYNWRVHRQQQKLETDQKPPKWELQAAEITRDNLVKLSRYYRATNLPAAPEESISVLRTVTVEATKDTVPQANTIMWNAPTAAKEVEIPIPNDYAATRVHYEGMGFPILSRWALSKGGDELGYRSAFATVAIGSQSKLYWNGGIEGNGKPGMRFLSTHGAQQDPGVVSEVQWELPPYGRALLPIGAGAGIEPDRETVDITPPAVNLVKVQIATVGVLSCTVTLLMECTLTEEAKSAWQLEVYDALYSAWAQWNKDYSSGLLRQTLLGTSTAADAGSSLRNEQVIREELKRQAIAWLLADPHFKGKPGLRELVGDAIDFRDVDFAVTRADAPTIQFMEQAFEWNNLTYVFYPYYWADRASWETRLQLTANDPEFERFLQAGSARVILPARPGFEDAVRNWLFHRVPFISGQLPAPNHPLYISIDKEIREIVSPWEGGIPGDFWQSRVSTTLMYLEEDGDLPFANAQHQLPAPQGKPYKPELIFKQT
jgi:hypothetical protein